MTGDALVPDGYTFLAPAGERIGLATVSTARREADDAVVTVTMLAGPAATDERLANYVLAIARRLAEVDDRHIVRVTESGIEDGRVWIVSELPAGRTLGQILAEETLAPKRAFALLSPLARGLRTAAAYGMRHHDLDPGHIFVTDDGSTLLLEPSCIDPMAVPEGRTARPDLLAYLPPERLLGARPNEQTNVHLLGGLMVKVLTGHPPGVEAQRVLHNRQRPGAVGPEVDLVLQRALSTQPGHRQATPRDFFFELSSAIEGQAPERFIARPQASVSGKPTVTTTTLVHQRGARPAAGADRLRRGSQFGRQRSAAALRPTVVGAAAGLALAGGTVTALLISNPDAQESTPAAESSRAGDLRLRHPSQWEILEPPPPTIGGPLRGALALEPSNVEEFVPGSATLIVGRLAPKKRTLPASARLALATSKRSIRIGPLDGVEYAGIRRPTDTGATDVYVLATTGASIVATCFVGDEVSAAYRQQCAAIVSTLRASAARPRALGLPETYTKRIRAIVEELLEDRGRARSSLTNARSTRQQARAARTTSLAWRRAARALADVNPPAALKVEHERLTGAARRVDRSFAELANAATAGNRSRFAAARAAAMAAENRWEQARATLVDTAAETAHRSID